MAMVEGPAAGLALVANRSTTDDRIAGHFRIDAVRGHLHERAGNRDAAIAHYRPPPTARRSIPERNYLLMRAAKLR